MTDSVDVDKFKPNKDEIIATIRASVIAKSALGAFAGDPLQVRQEFFSNLSKNPCFNWLSQPALQMFSQLSQRMALASKTTSMDAPDDPAAKTIGPAAR